MAGKMKTFAGIPILAWSSRALRVGALTVLLAQAPIARADCPPVESRQGVLEDIDARLEITLADGARLRLFGVDPPATIGGGGAEVGLRAAMTDRSLALGLMAAGRDRWGRRAARVAILGESGDPDVDVASMLIEGGKARVRLEPGPASCLAPLFDLETRARAARVGLWGDPDNAPIAALNREAFRGRAGQSVVVEGRIASIGETASRLYLNFGPVRTVDFAATATKATIKAFAAAGVDLRSLNGAFARVRGILDTRFGPQIEIAYPAALEIDAKGSGSPYNGPLVRE